MAPEKRHITRNRTSYSCQTCRKRKVKCDKKHPICGTCEKNDEECVYSTENNDHHAVSDQGPELNRKRKLVPDAVDEQHDVPRSTAPVSEEDRLARIQTLLDEASALAEQLTTERDAVAASQASTTDHSVGSLQGISGKLKALNLVFKSNGKNNQASNQDASFSRLPQDQGNFTDTRPHLRLPPHQTWESELPNKAVTGEQSNVLFRSWLLAPHAILPIVDPREALEKYNTFQAWYMHDFDKGIPNPVEEYMPLIIAIQYGGVLGMSTRGMRRWFPEVPRRIILSGLRLRFWREIDKLMPSSHSVAAEVMMRYMCHERHNVARSSAQLAMLMRNAQAIGVHRFNKNSKVTPETQILRRLWWEVIHLDTSLASACLIPPLLDRQFFDEALPSELKHHKMGIAESVHNINSAKAQGLKLPSADFAFDDARPSIVSVHNLVSQARALWTISVRKIMTLLVGNESETTSPIIQISNIIGEIAIQMQAIIDRIPTNDKPETKEAPSPSALDQSVAMDHGTVNGQPVLNNEVEYYLGRRVDFEDSQMPHLHMIEVGTNTFHKWARITLSLMLDQICSFGFGYFLRNPESEVWTYARTCAMHGCHSFFRRYLMLATSLELERYRWTWVGMFQPIHACRILLVDLYKRPFSDEAIRSRALFDQILLINYPEYGIVGGDQGLTFLSCFEDETQEGCSLLFELRSKAWQKAGLHPAYLWNEEDQIKSLQSRVDPGVQQDISTMSAVRPKQPLLPTKLIDEHEWRGNPASSSHAPFDGLTELIQKIRGSKSTELSVEKGLVGSVQVINPEQPVSSFYGEQLFAQDNESWSPNYVSKPQEPFSTNSASRTSSVTLKNNADYFSSQPHGMSTQSQPQDIEHGTSSDAANVGASTTARYLISDKTGQRTAARVGQASGSKDTQPTPDNLSHPNLPQDLELDFDWNRWDTAYGFPSSSHTQRLATSDADADLIMEAFGHL